MARKNYQPIEIMHDWYPWIAEHISAVPLENMLKALDLDSYDEHGTLWIERIDEVSNGYYSFESMDYDEFQIPMLPGWGIIRDHLPRDMRMSGLIGMLEDVLKYDVHRRHIAPLSVIREVLAGRPAKPEPWRGPSRAEIMRRHRADIEAKKAASAPKPKVKVESASRPSRSRSLRPRSVPYSRSEPVTEPVTPATATLRR